jgi:hypothetical protein
MKTAELIEILKQYPPDADVLIFNDIGASDDLEQKHISDDLYLPGHKGKIGFDWSGDF